MREKRRLAKKEKARKEACEGKQKHSTKIKATGHLISLKMTGATQMKEYKCKYCNGWHVGHKRQKSKAGGGR